MSTVRHAAKQANSAQIKVNSKPIKFTEVKDKRLLKATPMEREKLIFIDNSYNQKSITRSLHLVLGRVLCLSRVGYF